MKLRRRNLDISTCFLSLALTFVLVLVLCLDLVLPLALSLPLVLLLVLVLWVRVLLGVEVRVEVGDAVLFMPSLSPPSTVPEISVFSLFSDLDLLSYRVGGARRDQVALREPAIDLLDAPADRRR